MHNMCMCVCVFNHVLFGFHSVSFTHPTYPQIIHVFNKSPSEQMWVSLSATPKLCKINI